MVDETGDSLMGRFEVLKTRILMQAGDLFMREVPTYHAFCELGEIIRRIGEYF